MENPSLFEQLDRQGSRPPNDVIKTVKDLVAPLIAYKQTLEGYLGDLERWQNIDYKFLTTQYEKFFQAHDLWAVVHLKMMLAMAHVCEEDPDRCHAIEGYIDYFPQDFVNTLSVAYTKLPPEIDKKSEWDLRTRFATSAISLLDSFISEITGIRRSSRLPEIPVPGMRPGSLMKFWRTNVLGETQSAMATRMELWRLRSKHGDRNPTLKDDRPVTQAMIQQFEIGRIQKPELSDVIEQALSWPSGWIEMFVDCWAKEDFSPVTEQHQTNLIAGQHVAHANGGGMLFPSVGSLQSIKEHRIEPNSVAQRLLQANLEDSSASFLIDQEGFADLPAGSYATVSFQLPMNPKEGVYFVGVQSPELGEMAVTRIFKADMSEGHLRLKIRDNGKPFEFVSYDTVEETYRGEGQLGKDAHIRILGQIVGLYRMLRDPGDF